MTNRSPRRGLACSASAARFPSDLDVRTYASMRKGHACPITINTLIVTVATDLMPDGSSHHFTCHIDRWPGERRCQTERPQASGPQCPRTPAYTAKWPPSRAWPRQPGGSNIRRSRREGDCACVVAKHPVGELYDHFVGEGPRGVRRSWSPVRLILSRRSR